MAIIARLIFRLFLTLVLALLLTLGGLAVLCDGQYGLERARSSDLLALMAMFAVVGLVLIWMPRK